MYISLEKSIFLPYLNEKRTFLPLHKMYFLPYLNEIEKENLCVLLSVITLCSFNASLVSQHYNSGNKAEDNAAAGRREKRKKWQDLSDGGTLGPEQKTPTSN